MWYPTILFQKTFFYLKTLQIFNTFLFKGWCASTNKCVPGFPRGQECPGDCLTNWIFSENKLCQNLVKAGHLSNLDPNATHIINATLATPKLEISISNPDTIDHTVRIKYGVQKINENVTITDNRGAIHVIKQSSVNPLIGELHEQVAIRNHIEKKYIDLVNGTEINQTSNFSLFGLDPLNGTNGSNSTSANTSLQFFFSFQ